MNALRPEVFAERLRTLRLERGLTQQELADGAGVSARSVSDLERGINQRPRRETAIRLADVLGLVGVDRLALLDLARSLPRALTAQVRPVSSATLPRLSPLQGRETELQAIEGALLADQVPLLTLTGPGGVGKTRLAIEVSRRHAVVDRFRDGVLFVRLDGLRDPQLVLPTLAGELQLLDTSSDLATSESIAAYLANRQMLLILDNLEHLAEAALGLSALVARRPLAQLLVTSRDSLRIQGERVLAIPPLPRPDPTSWQDPQCLDHGSRSAAIAVYVQRARQAQPDLAVTPATLDGRTNLRVIAETCHRLDGLPLAIELAAAQIESHSATDILNQLKVAGLPLLTDDRPDLPSRHQTMTAAVAWSYDRLSSTEQALLRTLATFAGSFSLAAASAVFGMISRLSPSADEDAPVQLGLDPVRLRSGTHSAALSLNEAITMLDRLDPNVVQTVTSLARHHLLFQDSAVDDHLGPRFRMLEPIRLFALDRLREAGEEAIARLQHAGYFTEAATVLDGLAFGVDPQVWLERQVVDLDNFRSAQDWLLASGEDDLAVRLTASISQLWLIKGLLPEARQRVSAAIAVDAAAPPATRWFLRFWAGTFAFEMGDLARAGDSARELLAIAEEFDDRIGTGVGLTLLSRIEGATPEHRSRAAKLAEQAVETLLPLAHGEWLAWAWSRLGIEHHRAGRLEAAWNCHSNSLEIRRRGSCEGCTSYSLVLLGALALDMGDSQAAVAAFRDGLALTVKHDNPPLMIAVLCGLADLTWRCADAAHSGQNALQFFVAAEAIGIRHGLSLAASVQETAALLRSHVRHDLGEERVEALIAQGARLTRDEMIALAATIRANTVAGDDAAGRRPLSLLSALGSIE